MRASSLSPTREHARSIDELTDSPLVADGLARITRAIARHFPDNLFADLDRVAAELERLGSDRAIARANRIAHVHALFGGETVLRFRYAHDFLYGFDWARWVARDPIARASIGPYDDAFLDYSEQRAAELTALVTAGDRKYGALERDAHRNPFPFRRDLESERLLHRALAADGDIPVRAWDARAAAVWDRDFTAAREAKARALGLSDDADAARRSRHG